MLNYAPGDIVLVSFFFTGMSQTKRRPGLVLLDTGDADIVVARVTTQSVSTEFDYNIIEWQKAGLLRPSTVRLHKINTLEKRLVERHLGQLETRDWEQVWHKIQQIWS
jgi:mRNA interferase MazF